MCYVMSHKAWNWRSNQIASYEWHHILQLMAIKEGQAVEALCRRLSQVEPENDRQRNAGLLWISGVCFWPWKLAVRHKTILAWPEKSEVQTKVWILWPVSVNIPRNVWGSNLIGSFKSSACLFLYTNLILWITSNTYILGTRFRPFSPLFWLQQP